VGKTNALTVLEGLKSVGIHSSSYKC
jgi:hypothetical protein